MAILTVSYARPFSTFGTTSQNEEEDGSLEPIRGGRQNLPGNPVKMGAKSVPIQ